MTKPQKAIVTDINLQFGESDGGAFGAFVMALIGLTLLDWFMQ